MSASYWLSADAAAAYVSLRVDAFLKVHQGILPQPSYTLGPRTPRWHQAGLDVAIIPTQPPRTRELRCKPLLKRSKRKAERVVQRKLADGTVRAYRYPSYRPSRTKIPADSLEALIRAYRRSPEWGALGEATQTNYAIYLRPLEEIGHLPVRQMKRRELLLIRDAIAAARGNGAATGFMRAASAVFGWAVDHDWIEHTPVHRIRKLPGGHLRAWTRAEADAAVRGLPEHLRRVVVLARFTGQRRGDLCAIDLVRRSRRHHAAAYPAENRRDARDPVPPGAEGGAGWLASGHRPR